MAIKDIAGNAPVKANLLSTALHGKPAGSYIFSGEENVGKNFAALQFAKAVNCLSPEPDGDCCDMCANCLLVDRSLAMLDENGFQKNPHPDCLYINTEKAQLGIDLMRDSMGPFNSLAAVKLKKKTLIIQDAERMNQQASNSILKELEEPNRSVLIILIVNAIDMILPTIMSRCTRVDLKRASTAEIKALLRVRKPGMAAQEMEDAALLSAGKMGDALRYEEIKENTRDVIKAFNAVAGTADDLENVFGSISAIEKRYKQEKQREEDEGKTGIARVFLLDILKILSYIYKDFLFDTVSSGKTLMARYGIDIKGLKPLKPEKITGILKMIEAAQHDVQTANVGLLASSLLFKIRQEGKEA